MFLFSGCVAQVDIEIYYYVYFLILFKYESEYFPYMVETSSC